MTFSKGGEQLKNAIIKAIEDKTITPEEYEDIIHISYEDGQIDPQERSLIAQLQDLIENKEIKFANNGD